MALPRQRQGAAEHGVAGQLADEADAQSVRGVGAGEEVLHEDIAAIEVSEHLIQQPLETAPLDRLVRWCLPLLSVRGRLLALKGSGVASEVRQHRAALKRLGAAVVDVQELGREVLRQTTWVAIVTHDGAGE